jgi:hypothetical protein
MIALPVNPAVSVIAMGPGELSRVYKFEIPSQSTDQQIVKILSERFLNKFRVGKIGWLEWVWSYKIDDIEVYSDEDGKSAYISADIQPVFYPGWDIVNFSEDLGNGWVNFWWFTTFEDKGNYYELDGMYSGG